jgi:hypothetical protein
MATIFLLPDYGRLTERLKLGAERSPRTTGYDSKLALRGSRLARSALPFSIVSCYRSVMLKSRAKRQADESARAVVRLAEIQASISALNDEDLLDLADIFAEARDAPLGAMAAAEMMKRSLSL